MLLTRQQVLQRSIVSPTPPQTKPRPTTYDPTVGKIITKDGEVASGRYVLPPRGIAWIVSEEVFTIPPNVTALATPRTRWTNKGVLALTLGVVDPGWSGPLSTAVINFSREPFPIAVGEPFFRLLFLDHDRVTPTGESHTTEEYAKLVHDQTYRYSETFLNFDTLVPEVANRMFRLPRWTLWLALAGVLIAFLAIFAPIAITVWGNDAAQQARIQTLETEMNQLKARNASEPAGPIVRPEAPRDAPRNSSTPVGNKT